MPVREKIGYERSWWFSLAIALLLSTRPTLAGEEDTLPNSPNTVLMRAGDALGVLNASVYDISANPVGGVEYDERIIEMKTGEFDPAFLEDRYRTVLVERLKEKQANILLVKSEVGAPPRQNVIDLMEAKPHSRAISGRRVWYEAETARRGCFGETQSCKAITAAVSLIRTVASKLSIRRKSRYVAYERFCHQTILQATVRPWHDRDQQSGEADHQSTLPGSSG